MPYGLSVGRYLRAVACFFLGAALGNTAVHLHYQPLKDWDELVEEELERLRQGQKNSEDSDSKEPP